MKANIIVTIVGFSFTLLVSCKKSDEEVFNCAGTTPSYATEIMPIIKANCLSSGCHNAGSDNGDFSTYTGLKAVASNGLLEYRVITNKTMPPSYPLSFEDRKKIKCWINSSSPNN